MERVELAAIIKTVEKRGLVKLVKYCNIEEIMKESLSISNANGTFQKLQKSKFIQKLKLMPIDPRVCVAIVDMGMVWNDLLLPEKIEKKLTLRSTLGWI